jgi:hypothetical protein
MTEPYLTTEQLAERWGMKPSRIKGKRARGCPRLRGSQQHHTTELNTMSLYTNGIIRIITQPEARYWPDDRGSLQSEGFDYGDWQHQAPGMAGQGDRRQAQQARIKRWAL